jgi:hypothetical protein
MTNRIIRDFSRTLLLVGSVLTMVVSGGIPGVVAATETATARSNYEQVPSFSALGGISNFHALDRESLIVWAGPFRPFLIELAAPSVDLRFAHTIGIRSRQDRVYAGFDSVIVEGMRYPIERIYKLSREEARSLKAGAQAT